MSATGKIFLLDQQPAIKFFKQQFLLSNHHPAQIQLDFGEWGVRTVPSSEHGYFAARAWQFNDAEQFELVLNLATGREAKQQGKRVRHYNYAEWQALKVERMEVVVFEKVRPRHALLRTGYDEQALADSSMWRGRNELGKILERVRERLRLPPPQALGWLYVICQTTAPGRVIGVELSPEVQLAVGDTVVVNSIRWRPGLERIGREGTRDPPAWVHQSQIVPQAVATDIQNIAVAPTVEVRGRVARVRQGRGAVGRRAAVSVKISLNERTHALTQRGVVGNMAALQQRQQMVEGLVVPEECRVDHNYILPPYSPLFTRYEWEADGEEAVFPRRLRM
ncbi:Infection Response protein [Globodera pallida]|nr:Infection Response protein [Globodera pallida]